MNVVEFPTTDEFVKSAAKWLTGVILEAAKDSEKNIVVGLSGGSTPGPVYTLLSTETAIPWARVVCFLVDERYVPTDSKDSNQGMIRKTLLTHGAASAALVSPNTTLALGDAVRSYDERLRDIHPDVLVLGMGEDGHIASLFPPIPPDAFGPDCAIHTTTDRFAVQDRISVTLPVLLRASHRLFLITGDKKKTLLREMQEANEDASVYPAQYLFDDRTTWLIGP